MKARKLALSDTPQVAQGLHNLTDAISKVMGHAAECNVGPWTDSLPKHCPDRTQSLHL